MIPEGYRRIRYDGLGRRIEKKVVVWATTTSLVRYAYDGMDIKLEFDGGGTLMARYNHGDGIDQPLMMERMAVSDLVSSCYVSS